MSLSIKDYDCVPETVPSEVHALRFPAREYGAEYYEARTDRNIGWITREEQAMLRKSIVGIAGTGGMGGLLAATLVRLGIGEIRIADTEVFDISNINRQFAATRTKVGASKALETARLLRDITDDCTVIVYPDGINENTVDSFLSGCSVLCDEIEFWAVGSRILLHQRARKYGISLFNCNTVGFATHLFLFRSDGYHIENMFGLTYEVAIEYERRIQNRTATHKEVLFVMETMLRTLVPTLPEYCVNDSAYRTSTAVRARLLEENRASIIATNPPLATGFLADHVLMYLLRNSLIQRKTIVPPAAPGYLYLDAGLLQAHVIER